MSTKVRSLLTMDGRDTCQAPLELGGRRGLSCLPCDSFLHSKSYTFKERALSSGARNLDFGHNSTINFLVN